MLTNRITHLNVLLVSSYGARPGAEEPDGIGLN